VVAIGISLMFNLCTLLDANPMTNQHVLLPAASSGFPVEIQLRILMCVAP
jgi:hypothetical protein